MKNSMGMKWYLISIIFGLNTFVSSHIVAQVKYEREHRIKSSEVPLPAIEFLNEIKNKGKVKWYKEIGFDSTSIEAKTKIEKRSFSIEFNPKGEIEDIEIDVKFRDLPIEISGAICSYFSSQFQKYKIEKIQIQYTGSISNLINISNDPNKTTGINTNYELVLKAKVGEQYVQREYLFSSTGDYISHSTIVQHNNDNLEY